MKEVILCSFAVVLAAGALNNANIIFKNLSIRY